jgi:hypothetical protein
MKTGSTRKRFASGSGRASIGFRVGRRAHSRSLHFRCAPVGACDFFDFRERKGPGTASWEFSAVPVRQAQGRLFGAGSSGLLRAPLPTQDCPGFPVRGSRHSCVCGFLYGKPHEAHSFHQPQQEIGYVPATFSRPCGAQGSSYSGASGGTKNQNVTGSPDDMACGRPPTPTQAKSRLEWATQSLRCRCGHPKPSLQVRSHSSHKLPPASQPLAMTNLKVGCAPFHLTKFQQRHSA